jgi:hypothetical protein
MVRLKFSPASDETGEVAGYERGKVVVRWPDFDDRVCRYMACSLLVVPLTPHGDTPPFERTERSRANR